MRIIADLQIHSRYAYATSKNITIQNLEKYARIKGLNVIGTGDFLHPIWLKELKQLTEDNTGVLKSESEFNFVLQGEVSNIFTKGGKTRKIHNLILAKNFDVVDQLVELLGKKGKIELDGRPIFGGYSCEEMVEDLMSIDKDIEIIPAHVMTPWFGLFGSKSGFDSVEECFGDQTKHIHAIETGLSADPPMLWRVSKWNKFNLLSNSDAHSFWPWRIGREATVFDLKEMTYDNILKAIRTGSGLSETIEVNPAYGKYHWDGHRVCGVYLSPKESMKLKDICPVCKKGLTIGVERRIEELADRPEGYRPENAKPFKSIIPLSEIISAVKGINQLYSKRIWEIYTKLTNVFDSEFNVLFDVPRGELSKVIDNKIADAIVDLREGRIDVQAGYDGVYGKAIFDEKDRMKTGISKQTQKNILDFS